LFNEYKKKFMRGFIIEKIIAREIIDSRGNPTLEVEMTLEGGITRYASVPSGISVGLFEAVELRDGDPTRYHGMGVTKAIGALEDVVAPKIIGRQFTSLREFDELIIEKIKIFHEPFFTSLSLPSFSLFGQYLVGPRLAVGFVPKSAAQGVSQPAPPPSTRRTAGSPRETTPAKSLPKERAPAEHQGGGARAGIGRPR
jgi:hypothetical protein